MKERIKITGIAISLRCISIAFINSRRLTTSQDFRGRNGLWSGGIGLEIER